MNGKGEEWRGKEGPWPDSWDIIISTHLIHRIPVCTSSIRHCLYSLIGLSRVAPIGPLLRPASIASITVPFRTAHALQDAPSQVNGNFTLSFLAKLSPCRASESILNIQIFHCHQYFPRHPSTAQKHQVLLVACSPLSYGQPYTVAIPNPRPSSGVARKAAASATQSKITQRSARPSIALALSPTSVISNFTRPMDSPSAIARNDVNVGCPTIDDSVSRC